MKPFVSFEQISQVFSRPDGSNLMALKDVSFDIGRHEFIAVVGPSGCGKSTLLRLLSGLLKPTRGQVTLFGKPVTEPRDEVGIVFQKPTLLPWLNALENVVFPIRHKTGRASRADYDRARELITCLISFFPIVVAATTGMMSTPPELIELSRSLRAKGSREIWQIRLPYAVPHLFSGLKVAITLSIIGAVVAEFVAAEQGLGYFVQFSTSYFKIPQAFAGLFFLSAISLLLFKSVQWVQGLLFPWSLSEPINK